jgi:single-strand DNA-binding protein
MYQEMQIIGRLGADPTVRTSQDGSLISSFSVAVNRGAEQRPIWFRVSVWGKLAVACNDHLHKGSIVFVSGFLTAGDDGYPRLWKRNDDTMSASFELSAQKVIFMSPQQAPMNDQ